MKFATAAAVLIARTIPTADSSSSSFEDVVVVAATTIKTKKEDNVISRHPFTDATAVSPPWKKFGRGPLAAAERRKLKHQWAEALPLLQGRVLASEEGDLGEECDPSSADMLGILSCGPGRYCVESSRLVTGEMGEEGVPAAAATSSLGGFCVKDDIANPGVNHRQLQYWWSNFTSQSEFHSYICYNRTIDSEYNPYGVTCECSGIDVKADSGFAFCSFKEPACLPLPTTTPCGNKVADFCVTYTYEWNFTGPYQGTLTKCYDHVDPEILSSCETLTYTGMGDPTACGLNINGTDCNSCEVVMGEYFGITYCSAYDCSNTAMESQGFTEGFSCSFLPMVLAGVKFLDEELPCQGGCYLCGEGEPVPTADDGSVTVPGIGEITCWELNYYALSGNYDDICSNDTYRAGLAEQCGCSVGGTENSPTDPPVMPPTEEDDGGAPTDPPAEEDDGSSGASTTAIMTTGLHGLAIAAAAVAAASLN